MDFILTFCICKTPVFGLQTQREGVAEYCEKSGLTTRCHVGFLSCHQKKNQIATKEMTFIYLHGFNSDQNPTSDKLKELGKLGEVITLRYNSFATYEDILEDLKEKVKKQSRNRPPGEVALVGTSLGGYWAGTLSGIFGLPAILLNPAVRPGKTLQRHVGITLKNFVSGEVNTLSEDVPKSYPELSKRGILKIMVDEGDEVLDPYDTKEFFVDYGPILFKGGSHRFEHMQEALPHIEKFLNRLIVIGDGSND